MNANLYALLHAHFSERAEQPCLLLPGGPVIHYDDLDAWSARMAHVLLDAGCRSGDRVAVQVDKCWQVLALYLACLRAGLVYLPLNTGYLKDELAYFFGDAEPRVIVCRPGSAALVAALRPQATVLTLAPDDGTLLELARDAEAAFATVVSSQRPRGHSIHVRNDQPRQSAMLTHRNLAERADAGRALELHPRRRAAARAADLPRAWPVRRLSLRLALRQPHAVAAEVRCV